MKTRRAFLALSASAVAARAGEGSGPWAGLARAFGQVFGCSVHGVFVWENGSPKRLAAPAWRVVRVVPGPLDGKSGLWLVGGEPGVRGMIAGLSLAESRLVESECGEDVAHGCAYDPRSGRLAVARHDGKVQEINGAAFPRGAWRDVHRHAGVARACVFSPDGQTLASAGLDGVALLSGQGKTRHLQDHTAGVECLAFSPDGRFLASGSRDAKVRLHTAEGRLLRTYAGFGLSERQRPGQLPARILSLAWLGQGTRQTLLAGSSDGQVFELSSTDDHWKSLAKISASPISALLDDGNGGWIAGGDRVVFRN